jgi:hypothetical protein
MFLADCGLGEFWESLESFGVASLSDLASPELSGADDDVFNSQCVRARRRRRQAAALSLTSFCCSSH